MAWTVGLVELLQLLQQQTQREQAQQQAGEGEDGELLQSTVEGVSTAGSRGLSAEEHRKEKKKKKKRQGAVASDAAHEEEPVCSSGCCLIKLQGELLACSRGCTQLLCRVQQELLVTAPPSATVAPPLSGAHTPTPGAQQEGSGNGSSALVTPTLPTRLAIQWHLLAGAFLSSSTMHVCLQQQQQQQQETQQYLHQQQDTALEPPLARLSHQALWGVLRMGLQQAQRACLPNTATAAASSHTSPVRERGDADGGVGVGFVLKVALKQLSIATQAAGACWSGGGATVAVGGPCTGFGGVGGAGLDNAGSTGGVERVRACSSNLAVLPCTAAVKSATAAASAAAAVSALAGHVEWLHTGRGVGLGSRGAKKRSAKRECAEVVGVVLEEAGRGLGEVRVAVQDLMASLDGLVLVGGQGSMDGLRGGAEKGGEQWVSVLGLQHCLSCQASLTRIAAAAAAAAASGSQHSSTGDTAPPAHKLIKTGGAASISRSPRGAALTQGGTLDCNGTHGRSGGAQHAHPCMRVVADIGASLPSTLQLVQHLLLWPSEDGSGSRAAAHNCAAGSLPQKPAIYQHEQLQQQQLRTLLIAEGIRPPIPQPRLPPSLQLAVADLLHASSQLWPSRVAWSAGSEGGGVAGDVGQGLRQSTMGSGGVKVGEDRSEDQGGEGRGERRSAVSVPSVPFSRGSFLRFQKQRDVLGEGVAGAGGGGGNLAGGVEEEHGLLHALVGLHVEAVAKWCPSQIAPQPCRCVDVKLGMRVGQINNATACVPPFNSCPQS